MALKERCIVIPAIKKNAAIPDQLVKKLAGATLIERALDTARAVVAAEDIHTLTDSEEISLICERLGAPFQLNSSLRFQNQDIVAEMRDFLANLAKTYRHCIILRPSSPLLTWVDIENAWKTYRAADADSLVTVKNVRQRLWQARKDSLDALLLEENGESGQKNYVVESRALLILDLSFLRGGKSAAPAKTIPYFLGDHDIEIENYQDWWICERLINRRHIVFTVAGYPAIGMGHVYRALMLAHEISSHKITFVCTRESELAVENVAARDYAVARQGEEPLSETVLALRPDLVINDFLDSPEEYMLRLRESGARTVNFEDLGKGGELADLTINALDERAPQSPTILTGPAWFCLRDEFLNAARNPLRPEVKTLLLTFGGTDQKNFTARILDIIEPHCRQNGIAIRIVAGPGYAHKESLRRRLDELANPAITCTWATNAMSRMMEGADLGICSAGRTVYELAHMRVPSIVFATHEREAGHAFARLRNGFLFGGLMDKCGDRRIKRLFLNMLGQKRRAQCWERQNRLDFTGNKEKVVALIQELLRSRAEKTGQHPE